MVLAKEHAAVTGPRSGFSVTVLTHTTLGCLGSHAKIKPTGPSAV